VRGPSPSHAHALLREGRRAPPASPPTEAEARTSSQPNPRPPSPLVIWKAEAGGGHRRRHSPDVRARVGAVLAWDILLRAIPAYWRRPGPPQARHWRWREWGALALSILELHTHGGGIRVLLPHGFSDNKVCLASTCVYHCSAYVVGGEESEIPIRIGSDIIFPNNTKLLLLLCLYFIVSAIYVGNRNNFGGLTIIMFGLEAQHHSQDLKGSDKLHV
jgi:hypothetical protein